MKIFLAMILIFLVLWFLPPLPGLFLFCIGVPAFAWWSLRDSFPRRSDPDLAAGDLAETDRNRHDKVGRLTAAIHQFLR